MSAKVGIGENAQNAAFMKNAFEDRNIAIAKYLKGRALVGSEKADLMMTSQADSPAVVDRKLQQIKRLIMDKRNSTIKNYGAIGYDISGFDLPTVEEFPTAIGTKGLLPAQGSNPPKAPMSDQDQAAKAWAADPKNANDPRLPAILKKLGGG